MKDRKARGARWSALAALAMVAAGAAACSQSPSSGDKPASPPASQPAEKPAAQPAAAPAAAPAAGSAAVDKDKVGTQIKRYFEAQGQIPADVTVAVSDIKPSEVAGLYEGTLKLSRGEQSQDLKFLISADGRWFLRVDPIDLNVDPVQSVVAKIDIGPQNPSLGPKDAKVTIVEYSDFQCPFCAKAEVIVRDEVLKQYGDKVRFVYKQFPLTQIHPIAQPASLIGLCVFKQSGNEAYWKYHHTVFDKVKEIPSDKPADALLDIAKNAGADRDKVKECFEKEETQPLIDATQEEAEAINVNSTPTFFVNGRRLSGAQPLDAFKGVIDPELQKAGG
ncbi:MAG TPA: DsbA family protein [Candidatus Binatia bacterium]|nr:DsbA family protein [Candidatus Binatia bacterium]